MVFQLLGKNLEKGILNGKKLEEVWYEGKKVRPPAPEFNLDLNNGEPIGRMHDGELWFKVWVKDPNEPFKIAVNGYGSTNYDWDISIDGATPVRKTGNKSTTPISLPMSVGKHYVKITPHNGVSAGWARCLGGGNGGNYWNNNKDKLEFSLEWIPGYAFMRSENSVGDHFLAYTWQNCSSLTSMPSGFNLPQGITSVGIYFLAYTWQNCSSLTSNSPAEPINFPNIFWKGFAYGCFSGSCLITPDTPNRGSSVMIRRNSG